MGVSPKSAAARLLWLTVLAGAGLVASATAATVYAAGDIQRRGARGDSSAGLNLSASRNLGPLRALTDSLVAPLGVSEPIDSTTLAQIVALVTSPADSALWIAHAPADTDANVALAAYRRWARSAPLPAFWGARPGFPGLADSRMLPMPRLQALKRLWIANEAAADSALLAGDTETALVRARENIAGARHLFWQPRPIDAMAGRSMLSSGAKLLARTALQAQQPTLHEAAQRLVTLAGAVAPIPPGFATPRGRTLGDRALLVVAGDTTLHPATRFLAIELTVSAACHSTREVLFGPTAERHASVDAMVGSARDIEHLVELRPAFHRTLDRLDRDPTGFTVGVEPAPRSDESMGETLLRLMVPGTVQARIDACRRSGA